MLLLVLLDEILSPLVLCVSVERCQEHYALSKRLVETFHREDSVHSVDSEPLGSVTHSLSLSENEACGLVVHREENKLCALLFGIGELYGEVRVVSVRESCLADDFEAELCRVLDECITYALRVYVIILPDNGDFLRKAFLADVLG